MIDPYRGVGRNDPCPCGSGKKFKKCCLDAQRSNQQSTVSRRVDPPADDDAGLVAGQASGAFLTYDPLVEPHPDQWLALGEQQRIDIVSAYHHDAGIRLPRATLHAVIHAVIESQIADAELPVRNTVQRLMSEGLDRHEAIHAIGSVLAGHINDIMRGMRSGGDGGDQDPNAAYFAELDALTAAQWLKSG